MSDSPTRPPSRPPLMAVGLLSAAVLAYEILLMRLFAIVHWHHFAFMIISVALLGYGASGTFLSLLPAMSLERLRFLFLTGTVGFSLTSVFCFAGAQQMPFNALEIFWDPRQWFYLAGVYGLLWIPFFLAATGIGAVLRFYERLIPRIYAADLTGAGIGAGLAAGVFFYLPTAAALLIVSSVGAAAALAAGWRWRMLYRRRMILVVLVLAVLTGLAAMRWGRIAINPYKPLAQILRIPATRQIHEGHHPMGWFSAVESPGVPLRHAPGLSLASDAPIPDQVGLFVDAAGMKVVDRYAGHPGSMTYLQQSTLSLGFYLRPRAGRVLIAGAGGGQDVLRAVAHGARQIDAIDPHPHFARILEGPLLDFSGWSFLENRVRYQTTTLRAFLKPPARGYDVIQLPLAGGGGSDAAAFGEDTLLTVEGLGQVWPHLSAHGLLVMPLWIRLPPRSSLKAFVLALQVLENHGVPRPSEHLAVIRDGLTAVILVGRSPLHRVEREGVRRFCRRWGFDLVYLADLRPGEANRRNVLARAFFAEGTRRLAGEEREDFVSRYKFDLRAPTDDRPFFGQFFRWRSLSEIVSLRAAGGIGLMDWGYPVLLGTLLQAAFFSLMLIGVPLWWLRRSSQEKTGAKARRITLCYFGVIGVGFIFMEMGFLNRLTVFLHHPLLAVTLTLSGFLLGAGAGSLGASMAVKRGWSALQLLRRSLATVAVLGFITLGSAPLLFQRFITAAPVLKILLALALILPLALAMGTAFPLGMTVLTGGRPRLVSWAWGINGCATVIGAIAAPLLAIHGGYALILGVSLLLYLSGFALVVRSGGLKFQSIS